MKRRITAISTLAVLLLCGVVWARGVMTVVVGQGAVSGTAYNTTNMTKGFEADEDSTGWAAETDTASLYSRYSTGQAHGGTHSASVAGGATTEAYQAYDMGGNKTNVSSCVWFYAPTTGGDDTLVLHTLSASTGTHGVRVYYQRTSGVYHFGIRGTELAYGTVNITTGAWYRLEVDFTQNDTSTLTVYDAAGSQIDSVSRTANNTTVRYSYNGKFGAVSRTDWSTLYIDDIGMDWTDATSPLWPYEVSN